MDRGEIEKESERENLGSETFTVIVIGRSIVDREAALLSRSWGRCLVAL